MFSSGFISSHLILVFSIIAPLRFVFFNKVLLIDELLNLVASQFAASNDEFSIYVSEILVF